MLLKVVVDAIRAAVRRADDAWEPSTATLRLPNAESTPLAFLRMAAEKVGHLRADLPH